MIDIGILGAFLGGVLSFVSPCVLPLVPPYLCYVAGLSAEELAESGSVAAQRRHVLASAGCFVLGFSTVFVLLGATASVFGQAFRRLIAFDVSVFGIDVPIVAVVAGLVIAAMGLHFLGVFRLAFLYREARVQLQRKPPGLLGGYVMGLAFAFGWTPCIGPVLAAILALAGRRGHREQRRLPAPRLFAWAGGAVPARRSLRASLHRLVEPFPATPAGGGEGDGGIPRRGGRAFHHGPHQRHVILAAGDLSRLRDNRLGTVPTKMSSERQSETFRLFHQAILGEKQVTFDYQGFGREVCPYILGYKKGVEKVLAFQFAGGSRGGLPKSGMWRCFDLSAIENPAARDGAWHGTSGHRQTQGCVDDVYIDVNTDVPDQPGRPKHR